MIRMKSTSRRSSLHSSRFPATVAVHGDIHVTDFGRLADVWRLYRAADGLWLPRPVGGQGLGFHLREGT
jgi:hypothetical protein